MPGLNGLQLYYRLKAINRNIRILFVSALDAVPELISIFPGVKAANDIIKKPVALEDRSLSNLYHPTSDTLR